MEPGAVPMAPTPTSPSATPSLSSSSEQSTRLQEERSQNARPIIVVAETLPSRFIEMQELLQKMDLLKATVYAQQEQILKLRQKEEEHGTMFR